MDRSPLSSGERLKPNQSPFSWIETYFEAYPAVLSLIGFSSLSTTLNRSKGISSHWIIPNSLWLVFGFLLILVWYRSREIKGIHNTAITMLFTFTVILLQLWANAFVNRDASNAISFLLITIGIMGVITYFIYESDVSSAYVLGALILWLVYVSIGTWIVVKENRKHIQSHIDAGMDPLRAHKLDELGILGKAKDEGSKN